ncbi:acyltransferase [Subsaxibacter sp. CAU 1640]|uniref:acyltransferase family protein n=1 Tax=Subsaxibacter sp. CAU 1640 TaxID=2933271 RepID=UPI0020040016|nr:acyltransferase [Subsaxibacter sp. CAU 1640]MCK7590228.1 acyltransferase [Subsaxibacter sp. CAU 1640]
MNYTLLYSLEHKKHYLTSVTLIRGIAALAVCLFHFTKGFISHASVSQILMPYAWIGVEVFFVISGFVIPYMLLGLPFKAKHYGGYILKRLLRIEPAYLASIAIIILLNYLSTLSPLYQGPAFAVSGHNVLLHLGYLVEFFDGTWMNPVYWTLAIEFQYYIVIGFLLILWNRNNKYLTIISLFIFFLLSFWYQDEARFLRHTDIFSIGIVCAFYKKEYISKAYFLLLVAIIGIVIYMHHSYVITILSVGAALGIAFLDHVRNLKWLIFFGNISYSLYLLHVPIGGRVINLGKRFASSNIEKILVIFVAVIVSVLAAWIFYKLVEVPSHKLSRKIRLNIKRE